MLLGVLLVAAMNAEPAPTIASTPTGAELLRACTATVLQAEGREITPSQAVESIFCIGYVSGVIDGLAVLGWKGGATPVCLPEGGVDNEQAVRLVVQHLRKYPESLHLPARGAVVSAIGEAFICG